jgi:hypothetical protein
LTDYYYFYKKKFDLAKDIPTRIKKCEEDDDDSQRMEVVEIPPNTPDSVMNETPIP